MDIELCYPDVNQTSLGRVGVRGAPTSARAAKTPHPITLPDDGQDVRQDVMDRAEALHALPIVSHIRNPGVT